MTLSDIQAFVEIMTGRAAHGVEFVKEGHVRVFMEGGITKAERREIEHNRPLTIDIEVIDQRAPF